jgi:tRNA (adenine-N(1)-)-methyltransferase non-catalytic subunit
MNVDQAGSAIELTYVKEGDWVLIVDNETRFSFCVARRESNVRLGKRACSCLPLIGATYGSYFEAINGKLFLTNPRSHQEALEDLLGDETAGTAAADNRHLHDHNTSQSMTQDDIKQLQDEGKKAELVRALAENSNTFAKRTEFSQEKYLRKKTHKHQVVVQVVRPTAALVCKAYFNKKAFRILNMRPDALAHIVTLSNLQSGSRSLIIDECIGLVVGAALERANGRGAVYNLHQGGDCNPSALRLFNFNSEQLKALKHVPIALLQGKLTAQNMKVEESTQDDADMDVDDDDADDKTSEKKEKLARRINPNELPPKKTKKEYVPLATLLAREAKEGVTPEESQARRKKHNETRKLYRELRWQNLCDFKSDLESRGVDSLIIAGPSHPLNALNSTWRFLRLSGAFVLYSEFMHPLIECYEALFQTGCVVNLRLTETWHRQYQVLPKRTHPLMNMSAASGYILSGIKVEPVKKDLVGSASASSSASSSAPPPPSSSSSSSNAASSSASEPANKKAKYA